MKIPTMDDIPDATGKMYIGISWMQKSIRRGNEEDALHAAYTLWHLGFKEVLINRLYIIAHEDIGMGDPFLSMYALRCLDDISRPKGPGMLAMNNAILAMCRATKSRDADNLIFTIYHDLAMLPAREIPDYVYDKHTMPGKRAGRGVEHFCDVATVLVPDDSTPDYKDRAREAMLVEKNLPEKFGVMLDKKLGSAKKQAASGNSTLF